MKLMPFHKKVHGSWFMVHRFKKETTNYEQSTINRKSRGFTLLELIIVIAIIGIISSIGFYSYQGSQKKARDAQRKSDLQQVKKTLEASKNDCLAGSYYPAVSTASETLRFSATITRLKTANLLQGNFQDLNYGITISSGALSVCPNSGFVLGAKNYVMRAKLEITNDPEAASSYNKCTQAINLILTENNFLFADPPGNPNATDGYYYVCPD
ncbi:MAG: prepilin-type N-terminal cleavage/methylation domain-containing protein [Patescibacteria group bacterium]